MKQFVNQCQTVIQISTNYVSTEMENLKSKEINLIQQYDLENVFDFEELVISNNINQLIIHFRNYVLHNYLRKLVDKILYFSEKIFQRNDNIQSQLESQLGNLIITLQYIQQKLINYGELQTLKEQIDNLLNQQIQSTKYQVNPTILDIFNLQVLRDIYLTQFYQKYGIEIENYYKNYRKLSFDFQDQNEPGLKDVNNPNQENQITQQSKKLQQNYSIIISPDTCIHSQQSSISETNSINKKSKSEIKLNQLQLHSPQMQGTRSPSSNQKKYFLPQFKMDDLQSNYSMIEEIIQKKEMGSLKNNQSGFAKEFNFDQMKQNTNYGIFDQQSLFILRNYLDSKFTSNKMEKTIDLARLINQQQIQ